MRSYVLLDSCRLPENGLAPQDITAARWHITDIRCTVQLAVQPRRHFSPLVHPTDLETLVSEAASSFNTYCWLRAHTPDTIVQYISLSLYSWHDQPCTPICPCSLSNYMLLLLRVIVPNANALFHSIAAVASLLDLDAGRPCTQTNTHYRKFRPQLPKTTPEHEYQYQTNTNLLTTLYTYAHALYSCSCSCYCAYSCWQSMNEKLYPGCESRDR